MVKQHIQLTVYSLGGNATYTVNLKVRVIAEHIQLKNVLDSRLGFSI